MGRYGSFVSWYRLKSDSEHLYVKISGKDYLDAQPATAEEALEMARETLEATQEIRDIQANEGRILIIKLDIRDCDILELNLISWFKYSYTAANQNLFIKEVQIYGSTGPLFKYIRSVLPKYVNERITLIDTA